MRERVSESERKGGGEGGREIARAFASCCVRICESEQERAYAYVF